MKRNYFVKYLRENNCELLREGAKHSWWINTKNNQKSSVPRHTEIVDQLAEKYVKILA